MTKKPNLTIERAQKLLARITNIYEKFIIKTERDIIEPYTKNDIVTYQKNLENLGGKMTVESLMKLILRSTSIIIPMIEKFASYNPSHKMNDAEEELFFKQNISDIERLVADYKKNGFERPKI